MIIFANLSVLSIISLVLYNFVYIMHKVNTLSDAISEELLDIREELNSLSGEIGIVEGKNVWLAKEWVKYEILPNGTEKTVNYRNWKRDWEYFEEWKWVYKRKWQYRNDFRVWKWVEIRNNWSKIEWQYDDFGCQDWKWIKTDSSGNIVIEGVYEHWLLKSGKPINFSF